MYLNYWSTYFCPTLRKVDHTFAFYEPAFFAKAKTGLFYPVLQLAQQVRIKELPPIEGKTAFILAGGNGIFAGAMTRHYENSDLYYQYKMPANALSQIVAHRESCTYGKVDLVFTDHSACASSLHVLGHAQALLDSRKFARVIVLAVDDAVNAPNIQFFNERGITPSKTPSAFDEKNQGFYLGQGAVTAIFENVPNEQCLAKVLDCASASEENTNSLGMREDGQGYVRAMCMLTARSMADISVIKAHGTGTPLNDEAEKCALEGTFGDDFVATSLKPTIGHTMGTSGLLESVLLLEFIRDKGLVPAIANRTKNDAVFLSQAVKAPRGNILALAAGMGNIFSAVVWERL